MTRLILALIAAPLLAFLLGDLAEVVWVPRPGMPGNAFSAEAILVCGVMLVLSIPGLVLFFMRGGGRCMHLILWGAAASFAVSLINHEILGGMPRATLCFTNIVGPLMGAIMWFCAFYRNDALASYILEPGEAFDAAQRGAGDVVFGLLAATLVFPSLSWMFAGETSPSMAYTAFVLGIAFLPAAIIYLMGPWRWFQVAGTLGLGALQLLESTSEITITSQLQHEGSDMEFMLLRILVAFIGLFVLVLVLAGQRAEKRKSQGRMNLRSE